MKVEPGDYLDDLMDHSYAMKISYLGNVAETKQCFVSQDDFRLRTLIPDVVTVRQHHPRLTIKIIAVDRDEW